ncbi:MAG: 3-hydroxyacyl-CoA dehydrogenase NAD-binding domain-containing protein [Gemmatimonadaceae bacterium]|nr:3-hydroxyacyl-CoA dehydrogenase NAD-binding domain-containing protein [Gemmatimonadaceae bacterium]
MGYTFRGFQIDKIGVVGSGQIGPDIALYFAKSLCARDVAVVVVDVSTAALERGRARVEQKIAKGRESGAFTPEAAERMGRLLTFTSDYEQLRGASLVIEAATENLDVKRRIFAQLEELCGPGAILASNSSHIEPDELFASLGARHLTLVIHYFFPADRNALVEIVPGRETAPALVDALMALYEEIGKVPVRVGGRYGFAVNPVFEGLFLAAALAVEEGLGSTREVDAAARTALGLGVGPFTAMNLTGGNPITNHALDEMTSKLGIWWRSPRLMRDAITSGKPWDVPGRDEHIVMPPEQEERIRDAMRGAYFGLVGQILDSGIISLADLEVAVETGLAMRSPFGFMNELGVGTALTLVEAYAASHSGFAVPRCISDQARDGHPFRVNHVLRRDALDVAVLTIRRPRVLNALNDDVFEQLYESFVALKSDPKIAAVVLTGFGTKSFVSGADVNFLSRIESPAHGTMTSERSKRAGNLIEQLGKPVVCALNGSALGGGNELAMCCTARVARKGLALAVAQPEVNLGIVPGAGATQRLPRLVGISKAAEMLRTGRGLSGPEAVACGLIREEVDGDVVDRAIELARAAARGDVTLPVIDPGAMATPAELPPVELGHRSRAIDALMCRALLEGCSKPLPEGLHFESEMFGQCCATEDMRIGVGNFLANGPRSKAEFVHR